MEYRCQLQSVGSPVHAQPQSLCDKCTSIDCTNPIQEVSISIVGVLHQTRLYMRGNEPCFVVACEGFLECQDEKD